MSVDFKTRQIRVNQIINSGSTSTSPLLLYGMNSVTDEVGGYVASHFAATGSDTWLFVSGTIGSKNSASRGVATFGGDVVISGTIYNAAGTAYSTGGGGGTSNWNELSPSPRLNSTASVAIAGALGSSYAAQSAGSDVFFFVSGTSGVAGASARKSVFGGDVVTSGSHYVVGNVTGTNALFSGDIQLNGGDIQTTAGSVNLFTDAYAGDITIGGYNHTTMRLMDGGSPSSSRFYVANDRIGLTELYLATGPTYNAYKNIYIGSNGLASALTYIHLGSNVANSYGKTTIYTTDTDIKGRAMITGSLYAPMMSGSLTKLVNGSDYLRAGSNVTLTTGSDGSVTVASTGGGGTPAGSNTQVQFNADGAFAATSGLTFATGSSSLTISGDLAVNGGDITTTESVATIFSTNVSTLSLASAAQTVSVGGSSSSTAFTLNVAASRTGNSTLNLGHGITSAGNTKNVNIGQRGDPGSTTNIRLGTTDSAGASNIFMSGSVYITGSVGMKGSIIPDAHNTYTLGTPDIRWAHIYTGDLHLRNERGDWTIVEEPDYLCVVNNRTGKRHKMVLQAID